MQSLFAQAPTFQWVKQMGGTSGEWGRSITTDTNGNVYTAGCFDGTVDFDPGVDSINYTSEGLVNIFIQKLDANGDFLWARQIERQIGSAGLENQVSITADANQNLYITGNFEGTVDFDPGAGTANLTSENFPKAFILKLDANGDFLWVKQLEGSMYILAVSIALDSEGNSYITGHFRGTLDADPEAGTNVLTSFGSADFFVLKLDSDGNHVWVKQIGGLANEETVAIAIDNLGNILITGDFRQTVDFDPGPGTEMLTAMGYQDIFIQKLDVEGNFLWVKQIGGGSLNDSSYGGSTSFAIDSNDNIYTTGFFDGTADFNPGEETLNLTSTGNDDFFVLKLNSSGDFVWVKQIGGLTDALTNSIALDEAGSIYTTGFFRETIDFDPGNEVANLQASGLKDAFILKMDNNGDYLWAQSMGDTLNDEGNSITVDIEGNIYSTGSFDVSPSFYPGEPGANLHSIESWDVYVLKLGPSHSVGTREAELDLNLLVYPNPSSSVFNIAFNRMITDGTLTISDIQGRVISVEQIRNTDKAIIRVGGVPGVYLLTIRTEEGQKTIQVIKE